MSSTTSSNTLTSGFIDLATYDEPEKYMYGGAKSVSYFVRRVTKSTWFTVVPTTLTLNQTPQFATQWDANISMRRRLHAVQLAARDLPVGVGEHRHGPLRRQLPHPLDAAT
jgi:hypothetical protein